MVYFFVQAGVILYPRLHPLSAFAPDVTVRALLEGIQHVLSPSRDIRNPRNLNFFYFPTIQQNNALSLLIAPFRQLLAAEQHIFLFFAESSQRKDAHEVVPATICKQGGICPLRYNPDSKMQAPAQHQNF